MLWEQKQKNDLCVCVCSKKIIECKYLISRVEIGIQQHLSTISSMIPEHPNPHPPNVTI